MLKLILCFLIFIFSCSAKQTGFSAGSDNRADTLWERNKLTIKRKVQGESEPALLETSTVIINDSMFHSNEYRVLRNIALTDSLLNFMNHISEDYIRVKHFNILKDTLTCDIYFGTIDGRFYCGEISSDNNGILVLKQGNYVRPKGFGSNPVYSKISFKIYLPSDFKLQKVLFRWD